MSNWSKQLNNVNPSKITNNENLRRCNFEKECFGWYLQHKKSCFIIIIIENTFLQTQEEKLNFNKKKNKK